MSTTTNSSTASLIKMQKHVTTKISLAKAVILITLCVNDMHLSEAETSILAYFMVYGVTRQTKDLIVKAGICKNTTSIKTIMVKLKKLNLIYKDDLNGKVYVTPALKFELTPTVGIYLKITNKA